MIKTLGWKCSHILASSSKIRVHMNVVPRSTINTNGGTILGRKLSRQTNGRSNPEVEGSIPIEVKRFLPRVVP